MPQVRIRRSVVRFFVPASAGIGVCHQLQLVVEEGYNLVVQPASAGLLGRASARESPVKGGSGPAMLERGEKPG
jgi:hypothetical protein